MIVAEMLRRNRKMTRTTRATVEQQRQLDVANRLADRSGAIAADVERDRRPAAVRGRSAAAGAPRRPPRRRWCRAASESPGTTRAVAVVPAGGLVVLDAVVDVRDFVEPHRVAVAIGDDRRPVGRGAQQLAVREDRERLVLAVHRAGRQVRVGVRDRVGDLVDADAVGRTAAADRDRRARRSGPRRTPAPVPRRSPSRCAARCVVSAYSLIVDSGSVGERSTRNITG